MLSRPDARLTFIDSADGTLVIEVTSPSGIGSADLSLSGQLPKHIVLRLALTGLEKLDVEYGQTIVTASISSVPGHQVTEAVRIASGEECEISPDSPYWMSVRIVPAEGSAAAIPLQEGYIEVGLPEKLLREKQHSFTIRWVDFFR